MSQLQPVTDSRSHRMNCGTRLIEHRSVVHRAVDGNHQNTAVQGATQADVTFHCAAGRMARSHCSAIPLAGRSRRVNSARRCAPSSVTCLPKLRRTVYFFHHPDQWIEFVSLARNGAIGVSKWHPERLPSLAAMGGRSDWEKGVAAPEQRLRALTRFAARPSTTTADCTTHRCQIVTTTSLAPA